MYFIKIKKTGKKNQTLKRRPILLQKFSFSFLFEQYSISGGFHLLPRKCFPHTEDFQIASYSKSQLKKLFRWSQINVVKELISYRLSICKEIISHPDWMKCHFLGILEIINDYLAKYTQLREEYPIQLQKVNFV